MQKSSIHIYNEKQLKAISFIQRNWKNILARRKFKKAIKQIRKKNYTVAQLLSSQRTYCDYLKFIIKEVLQPSKKVIDDQELHQILFCNITEIFLLHHIFLYKLQEVMQDYKTHVTQISKPLLQLFTQQNFQSSYTKYCFNYSKADKIMKIIIQNNSSFKQILKKAGIINSALDLQSYMIKPVQRLCKYQVMLAEYFKNMGRFHPDYQGMKKVINIIQNLVQLTNSQVEEFLYAQRYRQLKYEYPQIFSKFPDNPEKSRKLVLQLDKINANIVNLLNQEQCPIQSIILFSDFMLVFPKSQQSNNINQKPFALSMIYLRKIQNMKYFKNLLQIVDKKKYYTFQFKQEDERNQLYNLIQVKTNYLVDSQKYNNGKRFSIVNILGTERRESFFKFYTVYIVQISQNGKITKIYPRFKNLLRVQDILLKKNIFHEINVPPLQKQSPHQTLKSKTIEKRKLHIRQFLQRIINHQKIMEMDQVREVLDYYEGKHQKNSKMMDQDQILILLPNWQHTKVHLNAKNSKIKDLKKKIKYQLQFVHSSQFQIFQIRNKNYSNKRLMYDDQPVADIYNSQQSMNLNPFADKVDYMFSRHYYLSNQQQQSLYKIDFIRLQLQISVIRTQILSYGLQEELMITFMCLFAMYINLPLEQDKINTFVKDVGKKNYKVPLQQFKKIVSSEEDEIVTIPFLIIKILSNSRLYQCQQFEVQIHKKCLSQVKSQIPGIEQSMIILGIKLTHILLLTAREKHLIKTIQYKDIESMQMHPNGIIFRFNSMESVFRIKTAQGYQINKLITIYKQRMIVNQNNTGSFQKGDLNNYQIPQLQMEREITG